MVLTEPQRGRALVDVVEACLAAGATAIQLRDKTATARQLCERGEALAPAIRRHAALFIVNDRLDVAVALQADGVHLGPLDLPVAAARRAAPPGFLIGFSTDDPRKAALAASDGADYLGIGALFGTRSKEGLEHEAIGVARLQEVMEAGGLPAVGIGGITPRNAAAVVAAGAGIAVLSSVMRADDPAAAVARLLSVGTLGQ